MSCQHFQDGWHQPDILARCQKVCDLLFMHFFSPLTAFPSIRHTPLVMGLFEQMGSSETEGWRAQDDSPLTCCLTYEIDLAPIKSICTQQYSNLC